MSSFYLLQYFFLFLTFYIQTKQKDVKIKEVTWDLIDSYAIISPTKLVNLALINLHLFISAIT